MRSLKRYVADCRKTGYPYDISEVMWVCRHMVSYIHNTIFSETAPSIRVTTKGINFRLFLDGVVYVEYMTPDDVPAALAYYIADFHFRNYAVLELSSCREYVIRSDVCAYDHQQLISALLRLHVTGPHTYGYCI